LHHQTRRTAAVRAVYLERSAQVKRMTTADDMAEATLFLASNLAKNILGQVLAFNAVHSK
jgi:enoyl-[acyl-carrier-protein] reductase (NADH)